MRYSTTYAVILSAGAGTRLGGINKGRLLLEGEALVTRAVRICRAVGIGQVRVVLGAQASLVRPLVPDAPEIVTLVHPEWAAGRTSSLQAGLPVLSVEARILLYPVDHPWIAPATLDTLLQAAATSPDAHRTRWTPTYAGERGHPILFTGDLVADLLALQPADNPRDLFRSARDIAVPVDDPAIVRSVKTPSDLVEGLTRPPD